MKSLIIFYLFIFSINCYTQNSKNEKNVSTGLIFSKNVYWYEDYSTKVKDRSYLFGLDNSYSINKNIFININLILINKVEYSFSDQYNQVLRGKHIYTNILLPINIKGKLFFDEKSSAFIGTGFFIDRKVYTYAYFQQVYIDSAGVLSVSNYESETNWFTQPKFLYGTNPHGSQYVEYSYDRWFFGVNCNIGYERKLSNHFSAIAGLDGYLFNILGWSYEYRGLRWEDDPELYFFGINVGINYRFNLKK